MAKERQFPIKLQLRAMPKDVHDILIVRQGKEKMRLNRMVSLEQTIYKIIKDSAPNENT